MGSESLNASFWLMILIRTIGSVDMPGSGGRKMPAPGMYVAIVATWLGLDIFADAGYERGASMAGWVIVLTGLVIGPFGAQVNNLLSGIATTYGNLAKAETAQSP